MKKRYKDLYGIKVTNDAARCLGIYLGHNEEQCYIKNWVENMKKYKILLKLEEKKSHNF